MIRFVAGFAFCYWLVKRGYISPTMELDTVNRTKDSDDYERVPVSWDNNGGRDGW